MFGHSLKKRGVAMVEYAVLLAFVTAIGGLFMDDSKLSAAISDVIDKAVYIVSNGELKPKYRYQANIDPKYKEYTDFTNELINKIYDKLVEDQQLKGTNQKINNVWLKDGKIESYSVFNDENGKNGGSKTLDSPIYLADIVVDNNRYSIDTGSHSHLCFDTEGNITNTATGINNISRLCISDKNDSTKPKAYLSFKQSDNTFYGYTSYWTDPN